MKKAGKGLTPRKVVDLFANSQTMDDFIVSIVKGNKDTNVLLDCTLAARRIVESSRVEGADIKKIVKEQLEPLALTKRGRARLDKFYEALSTLV